MKSTPAFLLLSTLFATASLSAVQRPNVVFILADDMGIGDVRALADTSKTETPHIDKLVANGLTFTDAHTSSSVCTPTRYGILTGRYNWRSPLQKSVLYGFSPPLIPEDRITVADLAKKGGYATACVGKWHLGLEWAKTGKDKVDYTKPIAGGPVALGFDYFYGISASLDMPPYVWIEQDRVTEIPTTTKAFNRKGDAAESFEAVDVLGEIGNRSCQWLRKQRASDPNQPVFLYVPLTAPHTPIVPSKDFAGKSPLGRYGDFVMETDHVVGQITTTLAELGILDNTLLIFTADNGCSPAAGIPQLHKKGHRPNAHYRGHKADIFDGGHRVPFIAHWPKTIAPGGSTDALLCTTDLLATVAALAKQPVPAHAGEDSVSFLPLLKKPDLRHKRQDIVHHSIDGAFAIRQGPWKLALCPGSGGWSHPRPGKSSMKHLPPMQLYHMGEDPSETQNRIATDRDQATALHYLLNSFIERGRSTPGPKQANDVTIRTLPEVPTLEALSALPEKSETAPPAAPAAPDTFKASEPTTRFPRIHQAQIENMEDGAIKLTARDFGWVLSESPNGRTRWVLPYACDTSATRNAILVLADDPENPIFCGVLAGMKQIAIWKGNRWEDKGKGQSAPWNGSGMGTLVASKKDGKLILQADGAKVEVPWPKSLQQVRWAGQAVRATNTVFSRLGSQE